MSKRLTAEEYVRKTKTSRRKTAKSGEGMQVTMRLHIKNFKEAGLIPDKYVASKEFVDQLPAYAKKWRS